MKPGDKIRVKVKPLHVIKREYDGTQDSFVDEMENAMPYDRIVTVEVKDEKQNRFDTKGHGVWTLYDYHIEYVLDDNKESFIEENEKRMKSKLTKVKIKTWSEMIQHCDYENSVNEIFGEDEWYYDDNKISYGDSDQNFLKEMEDYLPKDRIIEVEEDINEEYGYDWEVNACNGVYICYGIYNWMIDETKEEVEMKRKTIKVKIKTWKELEKEFGIHDGYIKVSSYCTYTREMEDNLPKDRIIEVVEEVCGEYQYNWDRVVKGIKISNYISNEMIKSFPKKNNKPLIFGIGLLIAGIIGVKYAS